MEFEQIEKDNAVILTVRGRMDAVTAPQFEEQCNAIIDGGATNICVQMAQVEYMSSAGLRSVLLIGKKLKGLGGGLAFYDLSGMVSEVFKMSGFSSIFPVGESQDDALAKLG
ncbi:STAS domain-containing protein [Desulfoplanes formicivorans]|uniref:Anti-sigma factor antagonist n=1 Tax=Desulfoplanes formicivorans TaxID=1592317 RepID=A0A194AKM0_9BACT|nr:STAS domain-containing protein [Desulfoplanes formicivorans]GAU09596.1 anti-anti-sigma factor [Desulfoplanes formicivorans]